MGDRKFLLVYKAVKIKLRDYKIIDRLIYIIRRLYIPNNLILRMKIVDKLYRL